MENVETVKKHVRVYFAVFGALALLTVATVTVASLKIGVILGVVVALIIATVKGSLVAGFFMHLVLEKKPIYFVLLITALLFLALIFITLSAVSDQVGSNLVS